jgi:hypothetical protein
LLMLFAVAFWQLAWSSECTMQPAPIDAKRIAHDRAIKSYVVGDERRSLTALLKNGRVLKLVHSGCDHSGATVSLWLETDLALSNTDAWVKEAGILARIVFTPAIAGDIAASLQSGTFARNATEARVVISASPSSFMSYSVVISRAERGLLLTIAYELG